MIDYVKIPRRRTRQFKVNLILVEMSNSLQNRLFYSFTPKSDLIDFTLSNARQFYSSKGDPLGVKGQKTISLNPLTPKSDLIDFTVSNER